MTWNPPIVREALLTLLASEAAGRYTVSGYQKQSQGAEAVSDDLRMVTAYYKTGQFPKGSSGWSQGPHRHEMTFAVELLLSASANMDLSIIENEAASAVARQAALSASIEAGKKADELWDELAGIIWDILMDPRNQDLGVGVQERWVSGMQKDNVVPHGEFVVLSGTIDYTCRATEIPSGETGVAVASIDASLKAANPSGEPVDAAAGAEVEVEE